MKDIRTLAVFAMALLLGAAVVIGGYYHILVGNVSEQLKASQKSAREAWGKVYDLQEKKDDEQSAEVSATYVKLWEVQQKLDACQKGTK